MAQLLLRTIPCKECICILSVSVATAMSTTAVVGKSAATSMVSESSAMAGKSSAMVDDATASAISFVLRLSVG
jgi:hypothetical protein